LEKRYPQVCEDCLPRVAERLKQSSYTAKTDHLRRLLDKTRQNVAPGKSKKTWLDVFDILGQISWILGIFGQLLWDFVGTSGHLIRRFLDISTSDIFSSEPLIDPDSDIALSPLASWMQAVLNILDYDGNSIRPSGYCGITISNLAKWSLLLSIISIWWNPKFKEGYRGYHRHIKGFQDWYKYQVLLLIARVVFWSLIKYELLDRVDPSATIGVHIFMLGFTVSVYTLAPKSSQQPTNFPQVTIAARRCFKVDFGRLFAPTSPERLLPYVGRKEKSKYDGNDMSQALTSILEESSSSALVSSTSQVDPFYDNYLSGKSMQSHPASRYELSTRHNSEDTGLTRRSPHRDPRDLLGIPRTVPSLAEMTPDESLRYLSTGEVPPHMQGETGYDVAQDVMEWKPHSSQYRAFQPAQAPRQSQLFSQAPVVPDQSPFWYKGLPPAPISQAHKARNPPNAPRLQPRSQEAKKNFFDRVTGRQPNSPLSESTVGALEIEYSSVTPHHEIEFAQQKFFPPTASDAASGLSEMFEQAFTLKSSEGEDGEASKGSPESMEANRKRHIFTALFLLLALLGWNFSLVHQELGMIIPLGLMIACGAIALRTVADCTRNWLKSNPSYLKAICIIHAGAQTVASGYAISEIIAGRTYCNTCRTQGAFLISVMLVQEVCFAAFS
jgi:hypothetical protein